MNRTITFCCLLFIPFLAVAQPANDNCASAALLSNLSNYCSAAASYTNVAASDDGFGPATCWSGGVMNDVWFRFTATAYDVNISVSGNISGLGTLNQPQIAVYSGSCGGTINEMACASAPAGQNTINLYKGGLVIGTAYLIRVDGVNGNTGTFRICINNFTPPPSTGGDCTGASELCNLDAITNPQVTGPGSNPNEGLGTCLDGGFGNVESNSVWYKFTCATAGTFTFNITPLTPGDDIDFAFYQMNGNCNNLTSIRCDAASCLGPGNLGVTGLDPTALNINEPPNCGGAGNGSSPFVQQANLVAGVTYLMQINNFTAANNGFTLSFGGTATVVGPVANFTIAPVAGCIAPGTPITFTNTSTGASVNNWTFGPNASIPTFAGANPPAVTYNTPGLYTVTLEIQSATGCTVVISHTVAIGSPPVAPGTSPVSYCQGAVASALTAIGSGLLWYTVPVGGVGNPVAPVPNTASPGVTTYYVSQTSGGCEGQRAALAVTIRALPALAVNSQAVCPGQPATLTATPAPAGGTYLWNPSGATTQSITVSPAATTNYTCTYTVAGCSKSAIGTVTIKPTPTVAIAAQIVCAGTPATLTANPSAGGGTYLWSGGQTSQSITVSPATTTNYTVTYTLNGCPSVPVAGTVTIKPIPTVAVASQSICAGQNANLTANPSLAGGTYAWSGGQTTQTITVSPAGTTNYTVIYTLNGCASSPAAATVTVKPVPSVAVASQITCSGTPATLTANPSLNGGTYLWSGGATTASITINPATTTNYTVTYTLNGCLSAPTVGTVTVKPVPTVTVPSDTGCAGQPVTLTANPSLPGGTYLWSPGAATTQSITVSPGSTTNYTAVYTLNGCTSTPAVATITVHPIPSVAVASHVICLGQSATLTANPSLLGGTYLWSGGQTSQSITVNPLITTNFSVTYTLNGCASTSVAATVSVNNPPTVAVASQIICEGQPVTLTAVPSAGGGSYLWSGGQTTQSITFTPVATGNYSVVYSWSVCTASASASVTVKPVPSIVIAPITICTGQSATLTAIPSLPGGVFSWSGGATAASITVTPAATTSYSATYTLNGCASIAVSATVTVNPVPTVAIASQTICEGQPATLTANPNLPGGTFAWSTGATTQAITASPVSTTSYSVIYTLTGCTSTAVQGTVTVNPVPSVAVVSQVMCAGESATLTANSSLPGGSYLWSNGAVTPSITQVAGSTTNYTVTYTLTGCVGTAAATVTVNPVPVITIVPKVICEGQTATLTASPDLPGGKYLWSNAFTTQSISVSPATSSNYMCTYTLTGCVDSTIGTVTVNVVPVVNFSPKSVTGCNPVSAVFADSSVSPAGSAYLWDLGDGTASDSLNPSHLYDVPGQYTVALTVTSPQGCTGTLAVTNTVEVYALPVAEFMTSKKSVSILFPFIEFGDRSSGASSWQWDFGDGKGTSTDINPVYTYSDTGAYTIRLIVQNTNGCADTIYGEIEVLQDFALYIPNAFTPNGDHKNDVFTADGIGIKEYSMMIFDRWGSPIYQSASIQQSWNGTYAKSGKMCPTGAYAYKITAFDTKGKRHEFAGHVALVR